MSLHDRPTATEILAAVRGYLNDEVAKTSDRRARFRALIARFEDERLRTLGYVEGAAAERRRRLCADIRSGKFDSPQRFVAGFAYASEMVARKLAVSNPRYLKR